jgi:pimeloyl-ACP methyl ester carboxylesterase
MKVLCFHGFAGDPSDWNFLPSHPDYVFEAIPLPGHRTALNPQVSTDSFLEDWAKNIIQKRADVLLGYSLGGRLILELIKRGANPKAIVLESTGLGLIDQTAVFQRLQQDQWWSQLLMQAPSLFWSLWYQLPLWQGLREDPKFDKLLEQKINGPHFLAQTLLYFSPSIMSLRSTYCEVLQRFSGAILYIHGEQDKAYSKLAANYRQVGAETMAISGASHNTHFQDPVQFVRVILKFLNQLPS